MTPSEALASAAASTPDAVAFIDGPRRLTYAEWSALADRAATFFAPHRGRVIALHMPASVQYPVAYLGAMRAGCITAGINPRLGSREVSQIMSLLDPAVVVTEDTPLDAPGSAPSFSPNPEGVAAIVFTSGTTGLPKGAAFTYSALEFIHSVEPAEQFPRTMAAIPLAHMSFMTKITSFIANRTYSVLMSGWNPRTTLETIERERITHTGGIPTQLQLMLMDPSFASRDLSSVRRVTIGGAPATPETVRAIRTSFGAPVFVRYSCTEAALATGTRASDSDEVVAKTVGRPHSGVDVVIDEPSPDGVGEILVRSPAMMRGYWPAFDGLSGGGFFRTGDLGRFDSDGTLHLAGRKKEMYIRGGYNVYPVEVEAVLMEHPAVAHAAVVGIPDEVLGERGKAFVVLNGDCSAEDLKRWIVDRIADYKTPDVVEIRERLPMTSLFKVDKRALH